ncbi:MAG: RipA family octameric membrane protein [Sulfobacillus sp.]
MYLRGERTETTATEYRDAFGLGTPPDPKKAEAALNLALDIRKFEIGLYWQRAAYFWALIAVAFAGYFAVLSSDNLADNDYIAFIISCIGLIFAWAWFLVNQGSKFWQENWENHVDMLEDDVVGPLYKTILCRPTDRNFWKKYVFGPQSISVSRVNLFVSIFTVIIWIVLLIHALPPFSLHASISVRHTVVILITLLFAALMRGLTHTHLDEHEHFVIRRRTKIGGNITITNDR